MGPLHYCERCREGLRRATRAARLHAEPSECFARFAGRESWLALELGGPAHWLAHELAVRAPAGAPACAAGYALQPGQVLAGRQPFPGRPRPGDVWIDLDGRSCGLVAAVGTDAERGVAISIRHLRCPPARVCLEDFHFQLHGRGRFLR